MQIKVYFSESQGALSDKCPFINLIFALQQAYTKIWFFVQRCAFVSGHTADVISQLADVERRKQKSIQVRAELTEQEQQVRAPAH